MCPSLTSSSARLFFLHKLKKSLRSITFKNSKALVSFSSSYYRKCYICSQVERTTLVVCLCSPWLPVTITLKVVNSWPLISSVPSLPIPSPWYFEGKAPISFFFPLKISVPLKDRIFFQNTIPVLFPQEVNAKLRMSPPRGQPPSPASISLGVCT